MDAENTADQSSRGHCLPRSLLVDHAAALIGVSRRTVYNRIRDGRLKTIRTPSGTQRVLRESLEALLREMHESKARAIEWAEARGRSADASSAQALARDPERSAGGADPATVLV